LHSCFIEYIRIEDENKRINARKNLKDLSGMDNPETQATLDTRYRTKTNNTIKHNTINTKQS